MWCSLSVFLIILRKVLSSVVDKKKEKGTADIKRSRNCWLSFVVVILLSTSSLVYPAIVLCVCASFVSHTMLVPRVGKEKREKENIVCYSSHMVLLLSFMSHPVYFCFLFVSVWLLLQTHVCLYASIEKGKIVGFRWFLLFVFFLLLFCLCL